MSTQSAGITGQDSMELAINYTVLGENHLVKQIFHKRYLTGDTPSNTLIEIVQVVHRELHHIASTLGIEYGKGRDPNLEMLCTCREMRTTRVHKLRSALDSIGNGTFSFTCQQVKCPRYGTCPQKHDLTEELKALPETNACVWYRRQNGSTLPVPKGKRRGIQLDPL